MLIGIMRKGIKFIKLLFLLGKEFKMSLRYSKISGTETEVLLLCHALEKGMSYNDVKHGFGTEKANRLIDLMNKMQWGGTTYTYSEAFAVLGAYIEFQKKNGVSLLELEEKYKCLNIPKKIVYGGYNYFTKSELLIGKECDFEKLVSTKHSMRFYSDEIINDEEIRDAIEIASRSPSACNRQPYKVYYSLERSENNKLGNLVPGNKTFARDVPYYCVITVDRRSFAFDEAFQWYLNGGIFVSYFTLALHSIGIGSCIFQYPDFFESLGDIRKLTDMSSSEVVVAIIGYGKYPDKAKCIVASRKSVEDISKVF